MLKIINHQSSIFNMNNITAITQGLDFTVRIQARRIGYNRYVKVSFEEITNITVNLINLPSEKTPLAYSIDSMGRLIIPVSGETLVCNTYGLEITGFYNNGNWRHQIMPLVEIVQSSTEDNYALNETDDRTIDFNITIGETYVSSRVFAKTVDDISNSLAEKGATIDQINNDLAEKGAAIEQLEEDIEEAGKVDDVKVNGSSVVTNKEANITIPTKTSDLQNDSNFPSRSEIPTKTSDLQNDSDFVNESDMQSALDEKQDKIDTVNLDYQEDGGSPSASASFENGELDISMKNMKMKFSELTAEEKESLRGPQGIPGEGAIWTGQGEEIMVLEQETGQGINKAMSQKAVTDILKGVDTTTYEELTITGDTGYYWNYNLKKAASASGAKYTKQSCTQGQKFRIYGKGGAQGVAVLYGWIDSSYAVVSKDPTTSHNTRTEPIVVTAPAGAVYLIVNFIDYDNTVDKIEKVITTHSNGMADDIAESIKFTEQSLTSAQKEQARANLGIVADSIPTQGSTNMVQSGGVYSSIDKQKTRIDSLYKPIIEDSVTTTSGRVEKVYELSPNSMYYVQITSNVSNTKYLHLYSPEETPDVYAYAKRISTAAANVFVQTTETRYILGLHSVSYSGNITYTIKIYEANSLVRNVNNRLVPNLPNIVYRSVRYLSSSPYNTQVQIPIPGDGVYRLTVNKLTGDVGSDNARWFLRKSNDSSSAVYAYKDTPYGIPITIATYKEYSGYDQLVFTITNDGAGTFDILVERLDTTLVKNSTNRTIMVFGDSLSEKDAHNGMVGQRDDMRWSDWLRCFNPGITVHNLAIGGTRYSRRASLSTTPSSLQALAAIDIVTLVNGICDNDYSYLDPAVERLKNVDGEDIPEIVVGRAKAVHTAGFDKITDIVLMAGGNDWFSGQNKEGGGQNRATLGTVDSTDDTTILGALNVIINKLATTMPQAKIYIATQPPIYRYDNRTEGNWCDNWHDSNTGLSFADIFDGIRLVAKKWHLPIIDIYENVGWNQLNFSNYFIDRDSHHPLKGLRRIAEVVSKEMLL